MSISSIYQKFVVSLASLYLKVPDSKNSWNKQANPLLWGFPMGRPYFLFVEFVVNFENSINFTDEKESNTTISFLDILIIESQSSLTFKVSRKPTNKNDYVHFYTHHNNKIKTGLIIGFYLRAHRIGSPQYHNVDFEYIENSFKSQKFSYEMLEKKALKIHSSNKLKKTNPTIFISHRLISLPTKTHNIALYDKLS